jgi:DNA invertase Pin-like site-specific DNA recombinase
MLIGYARTSTVDQRAGFDAQKATLLAQGCTKLFSEQTSSVGDRAQLDRALEFAREGDALVVTKLDRLARSVRHLCEIVTLLEAKGVSLMILDMGLDTSKPTGRLMLNLLGSIGQFEREVMLERQRIGIAKAKTEGKYVGRKPTALLKAKEAKALRQAGLGAVEIARQLGISRASVYRALEAS